VALNSNEWSFLEEALIFRDSHCCGDCAEESTGVAGVGAFRRKRGCPPGESEALSASSRSVGVGFFNENIFSYKKGLALAGAR
jgi:hypothetical protein